GETDAILQKPGKLTEEVWQTMSHHPVYAYEWLSSIEYLQPAMDIPHYHHERCDGTGNTHGLKGKQIPINDRMFGIVDVWDALRSDRPYRKAWPKEKTLAYIQEQSGKHFDPQVVETFLEVIHSR
ncbi:MAG: two-component system response regulator, partial [Anaerolineaceae bacterium]|nr:two-component system response regulator [Anaerolineaceae bacterium]